MRFARLSIPLLILLLAACATVYETEDFAGVTKTHKTVAILHPAVTIELKKLPEGITAQDVEKMERDESDVMYDALYIQFLNRYQKGEYTVQFQDIDETKLLLKRNDIVDITSSTKQELAQILGVDSVISTTIRRTKPMGTGAAIATTILIGFGKTNEVSVNLKLHDGSSGSLLWSYDHEIGRNFGSSPEAMAQNLMRAISRKFPYSKDSD